MTTHPKVSRHHRSAKDKRASSAAAPVQDDPERVAEARAAKPSTFIETPAQALRAVDLRPAPLVFYPDRMAFDKTNVRLMEPELGSTLRKAVLYEIHLGKQLLIRTIPVGQHIPLKHLHALLYVGYVTGG